MKKTPHIPRNLPAGSLDIRVYGDAFARAALEIGRLDGRQKNLPNPLLFVSPLAAKEATASSRIEGTISTISDLFLFESGGIPESVDATREVANYRRAMLWGVGALERQQLTVSFINKLHALLLVGTRGHDIRGRLRDKPVIIGPSGARTYEEATYIPPEMIQVPNLMANLESYLGTYTEHPLIAAALVHYQFEAIHPYADGNGRIGRLLVPLLLYKAGILRYPILYLSGQFDKDRDAYIAALHAVDETGSYEPWIRFFLEAVEIQACETQHLIDTVDDLFRDVRTRVSDIQSPYAIRLAEYLFKQPVFDAKGVEEDIGATPPTVYRLIREFEKRGIISRRKKSRPQPYYFDELLEVLGQ